MPRFPHLFLNGPTASQRFTSPQQGGGSLNLREQDRPSHAERLQQRLAVVWAEAEQRRAVAHSDRHGVYLDFYSEPGFDLVLKSLEARASGIRLLNVRTEEGDGPSLTRATVFVPLDKRGHFLKKVQDYATKNVSHTNLTTGEVTVSPKNASLVESIGDVRLSVLESFWQDAPERIPGDTPTWVEAWLGSEDLGVIERFIGLCQAQGIEKGDGQLTFPERTVLLIRANRPQLLQIIEHSDSLAEFRSAREVATFFIEQENRDQMAWVQNLLGRVDLRAHDQVAVLVLDHGVNNGHQLLQSVLADGDRHSVNPDWGTGDHHGHGTLMAGTAAYGDILDRLDETGSVVVSHCIESAKILPPPPEINPCRLWGYYTAQGLSRAEIQAPGRKRIICMAVTVSETRERGRPSSWSGQIDELASGYSDDTQRLFIVSAGNVSDPEDWRLYPESNKTNEVHDPA